MVTITFIEHNGTEHVTNSESGQSVMQAATAAGIPGIPADCGGACACATCHTYVDDAWMDKFPPAEEIENDLLECAVHVTSNSRLSCQLPITDAMDGLIIRIPESQF